MYLLLNVFRRYLIRHCRVQVDGMPIQSGDGALAGEIESAEWGHGKLTLRGWADAKALKLVSRPYVAATTPRAPRPDIAERFEDRFGAFTGFEIATSDGGEPGELTIQRGGSQETYRIPRPSKITWATETARVSARFLRDAAMSAPDSIAFVRTGDVASKTRVKARLGFDTQTVFRTLSSDILDPSQDDGLVRADPVNIILPVYNAFEMLEECVARVLKHTSAPFRLIIVEDASPDPRVLPFLQSFRSQHPGVVTLLENASNLGFIGSVNKGLDLARQEKGHVVLLNSDAFVPAGWCDRLLEPILADPSIATVTPASNDAEIASIPTICSRSDLVDGQMDEIDRVAETLNRTAALSDAPTGVGFCMAMNRAFLDQVPELDPVFGRGYGEEVDWCQKVRDLGGRNVLNARLFVEHRGGQSFGSEEKARRVHENNARITSRYPDYDREVQNFIQNDPMASARQVLSLAFLATRSDHPVPIYLAHSLGGGAENYLMRKVRQDLPRVGGAVILRVGGAEAWQVDVVTASGQTAGATSDWQFVQRLIDLLPRREIIYSCGVGAADPVALPGNILSLRRPGDRLTVLFHDYFPISPSYCLLGDGSVYSGVPRAGDKNIAHCFVQNGRRVPIEKWQGEWNRLIRAADEVVVFSQSSAELVAEAFPESAGRISCQPHSLHTEVPRIAPARPANGHVIGVLGNIGFQKGARVLSQMSDILTRGKSGTELVVVGEFDLNFRIRRGLTVHGRYRLDELERLVSLYGIECWLIPSIWPETFSYTTHESLKTGMPVFCCDLGAQAEAVSAASNGHVLQARPTDATAILAEIQSVMGWSEPARRSRSAPEEHLA